MRSRSFRQLRVGQPLKHKIAPLLLLCVVSSTALLISIARAADAGSADLPPKPAPTAFDSPSPVSNPAWGRGNARSFWVPAIEIPTFELLLNRFDRYAVDPSSYPSPISNFKTNLHRSWVIDNDKFSTNQFLHPYQGSIYQGFARSVGLDFWQAAAYTFAGSLLWEEAGENTAPSINDQVASGIGGNFFGEPLFRLASLLLEANDAEPRWWRELGAAIISPPTAFNRLVYGKRFAPVFPSYDPAVFTRIDLSGNISTHYSSNVNTNTDPSAPPTTQTLKRGTGIATLAVGYGLPGKPGYTYDRPFDYFNLELTFDTANTVEAVFSRGLVYGKEYEAGPNYRGVWGAYGIYDYSAPNIFRVSNTAGAVGTTSQWWLTQSLALQGTALAGVGYAGGGVIHGSGVTRPSVLGEGLRNYHYGIAPESVLALRLIFGDRAALDATGRAYYISRLAASESSGSETLSRLDVAFTVRVYGLNGITVRYSESVRDGRYVRLPDSHQSVRTINIGYTLLGHARFGAVDWR
jgi:hypothetical protein